MQQRTKQHRVYCESGVKHVQHVHLHDREPYDRELHDQLHGFHLHIPLHYDVFHSDDPLNEFGQNGIRNEILQPIKF